MIAPASAFEKVRLPMHLRPLPFPARALRGDAHVWCSPAEIKFEVTLFEFAHKFGPPAGAPPIVAAPRKERVEQRVAEQQLVQQIEHDQYADRDQRAVPMADQ